MVELKVPPDAVGMRIDLFLATSLPTYTRAQLQAMLRRGEIALDGAPAVPSVRLRSGQTVRLLTSAPSVPSTTRPAPEDVPFDVVYEDSDLVVIDKPAGLVVHPAPGHQSGTLVNGLLARYPEMAEVEGSRPGIVHRLDKDTSGLMVVARNEPTLRYLQEEMQARRVLKEYTLLCCGRLRQAKGILEGPIGRHPRDRKRMAVVSSGRAAATEYEVRELLDGYTLVLARLHTGRTHQIRVHFASAGHPLAGDAGYGSCTLDGLTRQFLHSSRLSLRLPSGGITEWTSPLPDDLSQALLTVRGAPA